MVSKLEDFKVAVKKGDYDTATEIAPNALDEQEERATADRALSLAMHIALNEDSLSTSDSETAEILAKTVNDIEKMRAELGGQVIGVAQGNLDDKEIVNTVEEIQSSQQRIDELHEDARGIIDGIDPGPILATNSPGAIRVPKGEQGTEEITIRNVGSREATNVTIDVNSDIPDDNRLSISGPDSIPVGTTNVTLQCDTTDIKGRFRITVQLSTEKRSHSEMVKLVVLDAISYLELAKSDLESIKDSILTFEDRMQRSTKPFENKIRKLTTEIDELIEFLNNDTNGRGRQKRSSEKQLDRIENHLKGLYGLVSSLNQLPSGVQTTIRQEVEDVDRILDHAGRALD